MCKINYYFNTRDFYKISLIFRSMPNIVQLYKSLYNKDLQSDDVRHAFYYFIYFKVKK